MPISGPTVCHTAHGHLPQGATTPGLWRRNVIAQVLVCGISGPSPGMDEDEPSPDDLALVRERSELRGRLAADQDQIRALQKALDEDSRRQELVDGDLAALALAHRHLADREHGVDGNRPMKGERAQIAKLQADLMQALRDNELLRQAISSSHGAVEIGHRTVTSTQLASAASSSRSSLTAQQRKEVADMVRRQENLRKSQAECFEQQVLKLQHERGQAEVRAAEAENRFAEASSNLKALEQVRAQEKREFEIELRLWDDERQILTDRIQQHALQLGSDSLKSLQGPLRPRTLGHGTGQRVLDHASDSGENIPAEQAYAEGVDLLASLRTKLIEVQFETDRHVRHAAEADEQAFDWWVHLYETNLSSRNSVAAEVALLRAHIASSNYQENGIGGRKLQALLDNIGNYADIAFLRCRTMKIFDSWSRLAGSGKTLRDCFGHLLRGVSKGGTKQVMQSLEKRMREDTSFGMFKVVTGLLLRTFRRPPFREPFLTWAYEACRTRILWRRSITTVLRVINATLRRIVGAWRRWVCVNHRHVGLIMRRKEVIEWRHMRQVFLEWSQEAIGDDRMFIDRRRSNYLNRKQALKNSIASWRRYWMKHRSLKNTWKTLKASRLYKAMVQPFHGWHVLSLRSMHPHDYLASAIAVPDAGMLDSALTGRRICSFEFTVKLAKLAIYRCYRRKLRRNERRCQEMMEGGRVHRSLYTWRDKTRHVFLVKRFICARQVREAARCSFAAFSIWQLQHPRRNNRVLLKSETTIQGHRQSAQSMPTIAEFRQGATNNVTYETTQRAGLDLQSLLPLKALNISDACCEEQGTRHMYFVWRTVVTQFENRLQCARLTKLRRCSFEIWLKYQTTKKDMFRKQALFQLRWAQTPLQILMMGWRSWALERHIRKVILRKNQFRKILSTQSKSFCLWKTSHNDLMQSFQHRQLVRAFSARLRRGVARHAFCAWLQKAQQKRAQLIARHRIEKRSEKHALQKAFLHFLLGMPRHAVTKTNPVMKSWTRSLVVQMAMENFTSGIIQDNVIVAHIDFLRHRCLSLWAQLTTRRIEVKERCHEINYIWPLQLAFRTWSRFVRVKNHILHGVIESQNRLFKSLMKLCGNMIVAWSDFTRLSQQVKKQLKRHLYRLVRYTLRPYFKWWDAYTVMRLNFARRLSLFHRRYPDTLAAIEDEKHHKKVLADVIRWWHKYARASRAMRSKAQNFNQRNNSSRGFATWASFTKRKAALYRKGMVLMQSVEIRALAKAFEGVRHHKVSAEIASQYRLCVRNIEIGSCAGHAFRVWLRYMYYCSFEKSRHADLACRHLHDLLQRLYRVWWVQAGRTRRLKLLSKIVHVISSNHLRRTIYLWNRHRQQSKIASVSLRAAVRARGQFSCYTVFRMWEQHVYAQLNCVSMRIISIEEDRLRNALVCWWDWCRVHRGQLKAREAIHERLITQLIFEAFRLWCYFCVQRKREGRRRRLAAYFARQDVNIRKTGGFAFVRASQACHVLKAWTLRRHTFSQISSRIEAKRESNIVLHSFNHWFDLAWRTDRVRRLHDRSLQNWNCQSCHMSLCVWIDAHANNKYFSQAQRKITDRRHAHTYALIFKVWYRVRSVRAYSLGRIFKAISWSNVRVCRRICRIWSILSGEKKLLNHFVRQISSRNSVHRLARRIVWQWTIFAGRSVWARRVLKGAAVRSLFKICIRMFRSWVNALDASNRLQQKHFFVKESLQDTRRKRRSFGRWHFRSWRQLCLRKTGARLKAGHGRRRTLKLFALGLEAFEEAVRQEKYRKLHCAADRLLDYKNRVARVMKQLSLKRMATQQLRAWRVQTLESIRHLYITKIEPDWVLVEIDLSFPSQYLHQDTLHLRTLVRAECMAALHHAYSLAALSTAEERALEQGLQVLNVNVERRVAVVNVRPIEMVGVPLGSPLSIANNIVRVLSERQALLTDENLRASCQVYRAEVVKAFFLKLHRWWFIHGRKLLRVWFVLVGILQRARKRDAVRAHRLLLRTARRALATWLDRARVINGRRHCSLTHIESKLLRDLRKFFTEWCWYHFWTVRMCERGLARLETGTKTRALLAWRAHTEGTLRGRWQNLGTSQISHAVHANKLMIVDRFMMQDLRFSFIRWGMRVAESRPLLRLVACQRRRHFITLQRIAFDILAERRLRLNVSLSVRRIHASRTNARSMFVAVQQWGIAAHYSSRTATYFVFKMRACRISKMLAKWKALLARQDYLIRAFAHRVEAMHRLLCFDVLCNWRHSLAVRHRGQVLQRRRRRRTLWWHMQALRINAWQAYWRSGSVMFRSALRVVAMRKRRLTSRALDAWVQIRNDKEKKDLMSQFAALKRAVEEARSHVSQRDGWLEKLSAEMEQKEAQLHKATARARSLEQMLQVYQRELPSSENVHQGRLEVSSTSAFHSASTPFSIRSHPRSHTHSGTVLPSSEKERTPLTYFSHGVHQDPMSPTPGLQMSKRSARGSNAENESPLTL